LVYDSLVTSYRDQLQDLVALFGSNRRAADFLGVSHSQLPTWRDGSTPSDKNLQRIADGAAIVRLLRDNGLDDAQILTALNSIWPELDGRPVELVRSGAGRAVLAAAAGRYSATDPVVQSATAPDLVEALRALAAAAAASAAALSEGVA
jgi:hypothetical protein